MVNNQYSPLPIHHSQIAHAREGVQVCDATMLPALLPLGTSPSFPYICSYDTGTD
jgi:hypothetical protein